MRVYRMNDCDWYMADTPEGAILAILDDHLGAQHEDLIDPDCPHEVSDEDMKRLRFRFDDGSSVSFAERLALEAAKDWETPRLFANHHGGVMKETPETLDDIEQEMSAQEVEEQEIAAMVDQILRVEEAIERVQSQRDRQIERIGRAAQYQLRNLGDELAALKSYSEPLIQAWLERHPPTKGRTRHLSTGSVGFRSVPSRVSVEDRDALIEWAKTSAQWALKPKDPDVDAREVISRCGQGDLPPGLVRTPERTDLVISPPKKPTA